MRKLLLLPIALLLLLAACVPAADIDPAPTQEHMTATPTVVTPTPLPPGLRINNNYRLQFPEPVGAFVYPDGVVRETQCVPRGMALDIQFPNPNAPRVPMWIHCDEDNRNDGILTADLDYRAGQYIWFEPLVTFDTDVCYVIKIIGAAQVTAEPSANWYNIALITRIELLQGEGAEYITFRRQDMPRRGAFEIAWFTRTTQRRPDNSAAAGFGLVVDWPAFEGVVTFDEFIIEPVSDGHCDGNHVQW